MFVKVKAEPVVELSAWEKKVERARQELDKVEDRLRRGKCSEAELIRVLEKLDRLYEERWEN